jgi:membrane protein YdbS with pleckstrin-like domain
VYVIDAPPHFRGSPSNGDPYLNLTETKKRPTVYESAVDFWIAAMLLMTPVLAAGIGIYLILQGRPDDAVILFLCGAATLVVPALFTLPCRYTILADTLSVRCGIVCYQVPFTEIETIEPSRTWLSGPALSMRRVMIKTKKRRVIVSPREREEFIADLRAAVANCKRS